MTQHQHTNTTKLSRLRRAMVAVLLIFAAVLMVPPDTTQAALSNISPNPADFQAINESGWPVPNVAGVDHLLKKEGVAQVHSLAVAAYFKNRGGNNSNKTLRILYSAGGGAAQLNQYCLNANANNNQAAYMEVTIGSTAIANQEVISYRIPRANLCRPQNSNECHSNNQTGNRCNNQPCNAGCTNDGREPNGWGRNLFFGNYAMPTGAALGDKDTATNSFKVPITIRYSSGSNNWQPSGLNTNSVNFRLEIRPNGGSVDGTTVNKIGPLGAAGGREFGIRSSFFQRNNENPRYGFRARVQFGVPCNYTGNGLGQLQLYDADTKSHGPVYMQGMRRNTSGGPLQTLIYRANNLNNSDFTNNIQHAEWQTNNQRWLSTAEEGNNNDRLSQVIAQRLEAGANNPITYYFQVYYPVHPVSNRDWRDDNGNWRSYYRPNGNVMSIGIPFDSIYGDISCNYNLVPYIQGVLPTYTEDSDLIVEEAGVRNNAAGSPTTPHTWQVVVMRYNSMPNTTISPRIQAGNTIPDVCTNIVPPGHTHCGPAAPSGQISGDDVRLQNISYNTATPGGSVICFLTRVQQPRPADSPNEWRYTDLACSVPGAQPTIHVKGHDLKVRGATSIIDVGSRTNNDSKYGSWGEYGVFSGGANWRMASGNTMNGGVPTDNEDSQDVFNPLTFANTDPSGTNTCFAPPPDGSGFGCFGAMGEAPVVSGGGTEIDRCSNPTIAAMNNIAAGTKETYHCDGGLLTINGNIRYQGSYNSVGELPRIIIRAKDVVIGPDVERIDAWVIADRINTCSSVSTNNGPNIDYFPPPNAWALSTSKCNGNNEPLTFNGPVITNGIWLTRTHSGSGDQAAEVFNLRPDAFLSGDSDPNTGTPAAHTTYVRELPPRF